MIFVILGFLFPAWLVYNMQWFDAAWANVLLAAVYYGVFVKAFLARRKK